MNEFIIFSFIQGMLAFLAPCAVALLPAYIASFISRNVDGTTSKTVLVLRGLKLASLSIVGILVIYATAGAIILIAAQVIKEYMKWIALGMGVIVIILGIAMLLGKNISLNLHLKQKKYVTESKEAFIFGLAYAIGALGCLFPLFLVVMTQAIGEPNTLIGISYILSYFLGMSLLMITTILGSIFAREYVTKSLYKILPHMQKISAVLLIIAGIYVINYQLVLIL